MLKSDALSFFKTQQRLADAIGYAQSTISEWPDVVPLGPAVLIERAAKRKVRVDYSMYERRKAQ